MIKWRYALALLAVAAIVPAVALATSEATVRLKATLNAGQEVPPQVVPAMRGHGRFTGTLTGRLLTWTLTYSRLSGPGQAAHIHMAPRGKAGPVIVTLCGPCKAMQSGHAMVTAAQRRAILAGRTYVNVHTNKNPAGEIRGQITKNMGM